MSEDITPDAAAEGGWECAHRPALGPGDRYLSACDECPAPVSSPAGEDVERVARAHVQTWESTADEVWDRPGVCAKDGHGWPCDAAVVLAALSARPVVAQEVERLRAEVDAEVLAGQEWRSWALDAAAERDAALARAEAAEGLATLAAMDRDDARREASRVREGVAAYADRLAERDGLFRSVVTDLRALLDTPALSAQPVAQEGEGRG
jgi:hypothetical protein